MIRLNRLLLFPAQALILCALGATTAEAKSAKSLDIYFIDVEGGQATLIVSPRGESLLVDTGYPGVNGRDADRIVAAAKAAGLQQLDYVLITHYHADHVGGVTQLAERMKIGAFVDHGPNQEDSAGTRDQYAAYQKLFENGRHLVMKPGDRLPFKDMKVEALTSAGEHITSALPGAGEPNPLCASEPRPPDDVTENPRSLGILVTFGQFRFIDLGDLTKDKELNLFCPADLVGPVDVYLTSHHGVDSSNARAAVEALRPRVAVMNNGAHKGGKPAVWKTVHESPGLLDLWQLHYAVDAGPENNSPETFIANTEEKCQGAYIKLSARSDGSFRVANSRNGYTKTYGKHR
jgi:beta-lactamase superfamily II metal-dependent hydrolase